MSLEAITTGCIRGFDDDSAELIAQMSAASSPPAQLEPAADRVGDGALRREPVAACGAGAGLGGRVVALSMPVASDSA